MSEQLKKLETFLANDHNNVALLCDCLVAAHNASLPEKISAYQAMLLGLAPDLDFGRRVTLAKSLLQVTRFGDALSLLASAPEPGAEYVHAQLRATALLGFRQPQQALEVLEPLIGMLSTEGPDVQAIIGGLYAKSLHHLGRLQDARDYLEKLRAQLTEQQACVIEGDLALVYLDLEQIDECRALLGESRADSMEAGIARGYIDLADNKVDSAERHFLAAMARNKAEPRILLGLAIVGLMQTKIDQAVSYFEQCIACDSDALAPRNALAWCKLCSGDPDGAEATWLEAIEIDRNFSELHGGLAVVEAVRGNRESAEMLSRKAIGLDGKCFSAWFARYLLNSTSGNEQAASKILDKLLKQPIYNDQTLHQVLSASLLSLSRP